MRREKGRECEADGERKRRGRKRKTKKVIKIFIITVFDIYST